MCHSFFDHRDDNRSTVKHLWLPPHIPSHTRSEQQPALNILWHHFSEAWALACALNLLQYLSNAPSPENISYTSKDVQISKAKKTLYQCL